MTLTVLSLDPPAVSINRTELPLSPSSDIWVNQTGIDWGQAAITAYEAAEQRWGSSVVSYRVPNRTVTIPIHLTEPGRQALQQKVGRLQAEGGTLLRQTPGGLALYADIESASLTVPDEYGDTQGLEPNASLVLECLPDFYGDSIVLDTIMATGESSVVLQQDGAQAIIAGDYPGRAQITVLEGSANQQFGVLWAFQGRYCDPATTAKLLWPAATTLTPAPGGTVSALSGAHGGQVITHTIGAAWTDMAYIVGSHVGSYQAWARVYCSSPSLALRFGWNIGDRTHGLITPPSQVALPGPSAFYLVNLGQVRLDPMPGAQQWAGVVQGLLPAGSGSASLDMLYLQPLDEAAGMVEGAWPINPAMLASGRLNLAYNGVTRSIAGGASFAPLTPLGDLPRIPPSGNEQRAVKLLTKVSRGDLATYPDSAIDSYSVAVSYRPSYLLRP